MLSVGSFVQPCNSSYALETLSSKLISRSLLILTKTHNTKSPHSLYPNARSGCLFLQGRAEFATKSSRENNESLLEMHGGDEEDDYEDDDEDGDEAFVPFPDMTKWFENKPPGFGEGKEYNTSVEDKLFEEMQQSRRAQLANINKLKNSPLKASSKNEKQMTNATEVVSGAIRVRLGNLPKKRNVHKDLQSAFKGFPGILNISPAVSANKKTRDPICKGFAFVDLAYEEDANRFIQTYSKQSITFGKVQKQIKCEITHPQNFSSSTCDHSAEGINMSTQENLIKMGENPGAKPDMADYMSTPEGLTSMEQNQGADIDVGELSLNALQAASPEESVGLSDPSVSVAWEEIEGISQFDFSESNENVIIAPSTIHKTDSSSSKQQNNRRKDKKNTTVKGKPGKVPKKLAVPGSSKRLRIKEKAVLTGVLAKYGAKTSVAS